MEIRYLPQFTFTPTGNIIIGNPNSALFQIKNSLAQTKNYANYGFNNKLYFTRYIWASSRWTT
jgi:hypothetical protein